MAHNVAKQTCKNNYHAWENPNLRDIMQKEGGRRDATYIGERKQTNKTRKPLTEDRPRGYIFLSIYTYCIYIYIYLHIIYIYIV